MPPVNLSVRMEEDDLETLDQLVAACSRYYKREVKHTPALARLRKPTRSSALRDLLLAWRLGMVNEMFTPEGKGTSDDS